MPIYTCIGFAFTDIVFRRSKRSGNNGKIYVYRSSHRDRSDSAVDLGTRNRLFRTGRIRSFYITMCNIIHRAFSRPLHYRAVCVRTRTLCIVLCACGLAINFRNRLEIVLRQRVKLLLMKNRLVNITWTNRNNTTAWHPNGI